MTRARKTCLALAAILFTTAALSATEPKAKSIPENIRIARKGRQLARLEAIEALGAVRDREALRQWKIVRVLLKLMRDRNPNFARLALRGIMNLYRFDASLKREVIDSIARLLQNAGSHGVILIEAANALGELILAGELQDRSALDAVMRAAGPSAANSPEVVAACLRALGGIGDPRAREAVRGALSGGRFRDKQARHEIRDAALDAFANALRGPNARAWLDAALTARLSDLLDQRDLPPRTRVKVIEIMARLPSLGVAVRGLEARLLKSLDKEAKPDVAIATMDALASMGGERVAGALASAYERFGKDNDGQSVEARAAACAASGRLLAEWSMLAKVPAKPAAGLVRLLVRAMADPDKRVVTCAIVSLGNLFDARYDRTLAATALIAMLGTKNIDERTRRLVVGSLEVITGRVRGDDAAQWEKWLGRNRPKLKPGS